MKGKTNLIVCATVTVLLFFVIPPAIGANETVLQMADGVVRPAPIKGAEQAYLPIIMPSNHASNLLLLSNGDLLCFWFSGTGEGRSGVSIVMARLDHDSNRWTEPVVLSRRRGWSNQNPVPFQAPDGRIWLLHTSQKANEGQTTAQVLYLTSGDNGHTWTPPKPLFTDPGSFDRQPLIIFHRTWLFPMYHSASRGITRNAQNDYSVVRISKDRGINWTGCDVPESGGLVQMNILKISDQRLIAFFRSRYADWIYKSLSSDGCRWSAPVPTQLPNNNSSIQAVRLKDGNLLMAFNNAQAAATRGGPRTAARKVLSIALSTDNGETWAWVRDVQAGDTPPPFLRGEDSEYSYPSIIQARSGWIDLTFTFRRETIKYMTFPESWVKQGTSVGVFKGAPQNRPEERAVH